VTAPEYLPLPAAGGDTRRSGFTRSIHVAIVHVVFKFPKKRAGSMGARNTDD